MPRVYLSPSTQEGNLFVNGGTEEQYMNYIVDRMIPYLNSAGILYTRNTPQMTSATSVRQANAGYYDLYLAIHSNAAPEERSGDVKGAVVFYYPTSVRGKRAATIIAKNYKKIYPQPELVNIMPTSTLIEVRASKAPAVLIETAYHDNIEDANFIKDNLDSIARNLSMSVAEYLGVPFVEPQEPQFGTVTLQSGNLNIRSRPTLSAPILKRAPNGSKITVLGKWQDFYVVNYNNVIGYVRSQYVTL